MNKIIEEIWKTYRLKCGVSEKEREGEKKIISIQQNLFKIMSAEQVELLCKYEESRDKIGEEREMEAFGAGVRFAVFFLVDALKSEE